MYRIELESEVKETKYMFINVKFQNLAKAQLKIKTYIWSKIIKVVEIYIIECPYRNLHSHPS